MLAVTLLSHPVQAARSFIDFIRCRSVKTGLNLQLNQPNTSRPRSCGLGPHLGAPQLIPLGHKAHGEHSNLPGDTRGLKPLTDKELAKGHLIRSSRSPHEFSKGLWSKTENEKLVRNEEDGDNGLIRARWQQWW